MPVCFAVTSDPSGCQADQSRTGASFGHAEDVFDAQVAAGGVLWKRSLFAEEPLDQIALAVVPLAEDRLPFAAKRQEAFLLPAFSFTTQK